MSRPHIAVVMPVWITKAWQIAMTDFAIDLLVMGADASHQPTIILVIADDGPTPGFRSRVDTLKGLPPGNATADINAGIEHAVLRQAADVVVYAGNDVFVRPGWDEALLEALRLPDCGIATLASADLAKTPGGAYAGTPTITEGIYGPFMAWHARWDVSPKAIKYMDEVAFPGPFADSDFILKHYAAGVRSYRNNRVVIQHLNRMTTDTPTYKAEYDAAHKRFNARWAVSPMTFAARALIEGWIL